MQIPVIDMKPGDLGLGSTVYLQATSAAGAPLGLKRQINPSAVAADTVWYMVLGVQIQLLLISEIN